ncbi:hypothetical protein D8L93_05660 [Sodalis-like symbiont of Bactericera trigonica]|nr:hypothetical protein D8L93_05660 [Sodalis-like symbiont of Bactericera trigonica]
MLEKRLLTYRLHGDAWQTRRILQLASSEQHDQQPRDPMIVCVGYLRFNGQLQRSLREGGLFGADVDSAGR